MSTRSPFLVILPLLAPLALFAALACSSSPARAAVSNMTIYDDSLENGWANWSWSSTINLSKTSPVHSGSDSMAVTITGAWGALYLEHPDMDDSPYNAITFYINGGSTGGQRLNLIGLLGGTVQSSYAIPALAAGTWTQITAPLTTLGVSGGANFDGFYIQDAIGAAQPVFYVDDVTLVSGAPPPPDGSLSVDATANVHPISPQIYGVAFAGASDLTTLNAPLNRAGGNAESMYNWKINATNHAADWFFESIGDSPATAGADWDSFVTSSKAGGAQPMLTMPEIGWVANLGANRSILPAFSIAKYGAQKSVDPYDSDAGNGVHTDGTNVTGNDPNDASVPADVTFESGGVSHLISKWGTSANGGVQYYLNDNEPSIWFQTHRDVHPIGPTMDEIYSDTVNYGAMVKSADPNALVMGPEEWGWSGYFYSGYDQQYGGLHGWSTLPDRAAHGNMDYIPWLLQQMQAYQTNSPTNQRLLDYVTVHFYPQGGEGGDDVSAPTELLRNRSTRQLWDPSYSSESWIGTPVYLIPRMKQWVTQYYPGTKTGITEYNWGAEGSMNGATTQADIFGIFGQQGLDLATRWTTPATGSPAYESMKIYRNYDGNKSTFGDTSVSDTAPNPDNMSSFAAIRTSDGAMTVMVINKILSGSTPVNLSVAHFSALGPAHVWQLASPGSSIAQLADLTVTGGLVSFTAPAQTVTLLVIPAAPVGPAISGVSVAASSVKGGANVTGTVTLTLPAPTGGATVTLISSNTAVASVPASVKVAAGATSKSFTVTTKPVAANAAVTITGTFNGVQKTAALNVVAPSLSGLTISPTSVVGGNPSTGTVTLTSVTAADTLVTLSSNNAHATVPTTVTVLAGTKSAVFTVTTTHAANAQTASISATLGTVTKKANLKLTL